MHGLQDGDGQTREGFDGRDDITHPSADNPPERRNLQAMVRIRC